MDRMKSNAECRVMNKDQQRSIFIPHSAFITLHFFFILTISVHPVNSSPGATGCFRNLVQRSKSNPGNPSRGVRPADKPASD
jgi:hypothetical protein